MNYYLAVIIIIISIIIYIIFINETIREEIYSWIVKKPIYAVANFNNNIKGKIIFREDLQAGDIIIDIDLNSDIENGKHGLIIYNTGDINDDNISHFNPYNKRHGDINSGHVGDLGNIEFRDGISKHIFRTKKLKLRGYNSIIGRCIVIHENEDDLGILDYETSHINGNVGGYISTSVIGYYKIME